MESPITYIGCAGWQIRTDHKAYFPDEGTHLDRYARIFNAVEINSSFYKPHQAKTYSRWAASVPDTFKFSVKAPKTISHETSLTEPDLLVPFLAHIEALGSKLGPILVQLPPKLEFQEATAKRFFTFFRKKFDGQIVIEPRHVSWFDDSTEDFLLTYSLARVAANPANFPKAERPGGFKNTDYYRLHGSPKIYYSEYSEEYIEALARLARASSCLHNNRKRKELWYIFDNTARGAATINALQLKAQLKQES